MTKQIRVGLLGCGVVGTGVLGVLASKRDTIRHQFGVDLVIERIAVRDTTRQRHSIVDMAKLSGDWKTVCTSDDVDVVIEVVGGTDVAKDAVFTALEFGKPVITANKELMARFGDSIRQTAQRHEACVRCEASVLGGVPVLSTLETYFALNDIRKLRGIVNGTSNYILSRMYKDSESFENALHGATVLGYAESDPSMDIDGIDAWLKLQILLDYIGVPHSQRRGGEIHGIRSITDADMSVARLCRQKIKHVVSAEWDQEGLVNLRVEPQWLDESDSLYNVDGVQNALCLEGDVVGEITLLGPGAGAYPTASAILEDLLKVLPIYEGAKPSPFTGIA